MPKQTVMPNVSKPSGGPRRVLAGALLVIAAAGIAWAGDDPKNPPRFDDVYRRTQDVLRRVDAGRADVGPSAVSMRVLPRSSQAPTGFEYVYRIERGKYAGRFARRDGAITAVFPRSVYSDIDGIFVPSIPPGTTFVVGALGAGDSGGAPDRGTGSVAMRPNMGVLRAASQPAGMGAVEMRAPTNAAVRSAPARAPEGLSPAASSRPALPARTMWTDESIRSDRIGALLESVRRVRRTPR